MENSNLINGNTFADISDFIVDRDRRDLTTEIFRKNCILFCKTDFLPLLFNHLRFSKRKYILISHMSDYPINSDRFKSKPDCIVKWYAQNATYDHPDLIPIPIGVENHKGASKGIFTDHTWLKENFEKLKNKDKDNQLYCNWNPNTNQKVRGPLVEHLKTNGLPVFLESGLSYQEYCSNMSDHQWVVCPPGNGVDTHRLWEALYLGCFPITLKHNIYKNYDLPILQVDKWDDVNKDLLEDHLDKWKSKKYQMHNMDYWTNLIKNNLQEYD